MTKMKTQKRNKTKPKTKDIIFIIIIVAYSIALIYFDAEIDIILKSIGGKQ